MQAGNPNWEKGVSGNPDGRPKGMTLKEHARARFLAMSPETKDKFLDRISPTDLWKMSEGNPAQDLTSAGEKIEVIPIYGGRTIQGYPSDPEDISTEPENTSSSGGDISE